MADKLCHKNINNNEEERVTVTAAKVTSVTARMGGRVTKVGQLLPTIANCCQLLPTVTTQVGAGAVARLAIALGAGRLHPSDTLDLGAGVELRVEPGDVVTRGEEWARVHHNRDIPPQLLSGNICCNNVTVLTNLC